MVVRFKRRDRNRLRHGSAECRCRPARRCVCMGLVTSVEPRILLGVTFVPRYTQPMRVLGIDCGGEYTGYGVVEMQSDGKLCCLTCGAIKLSARETLPRRLSRIYSQLGVVISEHQPDEV